MLVHLFCLNRSEEEHLDVCSFYEKEDLQSSCMPWPSLSQLHIKMNDTFVNIPVCLCNLAMNFSISLSCSVAPLPSLIYLGLSNVAKIAYSSCNCATYLKLLS